MPQRIYLDNAATSWPKPERVYRAVDDYQRRLGAPAGRGTYAEASETERLVSSCRQRISRLVGGTDPRRAIFTHNGTDSLNLVLHGVLRPGDHVVTSVCEHNSVLRPLRYLAEHRGITATYVSCDSRGQVDPDQFRQALRPETRLIALVHGSNVTGAIQPVAEVGRLSAEHGHLYLVDAAQTLGYCPVDVKQIGCHYLAAPGHKGLLGPLGTGLLYVAEGAEEHLQPMRQGGTGTRSDEDVQPASLPDRYESGNLNALGIVGLEAGLAHLAETDIGREAARLAELTRALLAGLAGLPGVTVYGPPADALRLPVISLNVAGFAPQELAALLDVQWSIQSRAGIHCAPRMHAALGTAPLGTLRLSLGHFTTSDDVSAAIAAIADVASSQ
jgi:cysteine desulfurase/selenocysteine lyase